MATVQKKKNITRARKPEAVGVSSKEVQAFIDQCMAENKELHSIMVLRHGKIACEAYREPYGPEYKHMMYSVSKSFTSTAIGFAIDEGILALDTKFVEIFPEARGEKYDAYLEKLNVEDLLSMKSGFSVTPFMDKTKDKWFHEIVNSEWVSEPGTEFLYISENMYLLCCMIHKLTGMSVVEYLTPRLFEPLGIDVPYWETCPRGVEAGGWGLMLSTMDLAKFTLCYQKKGKFGGKQVLPKGWAEQASAFHSDNSPTSQDLDSCVGYGYCFWRNGGYKNSYRADGMFCQFGIVFEDLDACVIITGGEIYEQGMRNTVWDHFPKAFIDDDPEAETMKIAIPPYEKLPVKPRSYLEKELAGKKIVFNKPLLLNTIGFPVSVITLPAIYMGKDKAGNISNVSFEPLENELIMTWSEGDEVNRIHVGMDGEYRWDNITLGQMPFTTCAMGCWNSEGELQILIRPIESVAARLLTFKFNGDKVTLKPSSAPSLMDMVGTLKKSLGGILKQPIVQKAVDVALPLAVPLVDVVHHGKIK